MFNTHPTRIWCASRKPSSKNSKLISYGLTSFTINAGKITDTKLNPIMKSVGTNTTYDKTDVFCTLFH